MSEPASARRFDGRIADYIAARPGYPDAFFDAIARAGAAVDDADVADIGCGTGLSALPLLRRGCRVVGVEPGAAMRASCARLLADPWIAGGRLRLVDGRAEAMPLEAESVDTILAAQAFHWFDPPRARAEFRRVLRPGGRVVLAWNDRRSRGSAFLEGYEALLHAHAVDFAQVDHRRIDAAAIEAFFAGAAAPPVMVCIEHVQPLDRAGLHARIRSSSYMPASGDPADARFTAMVAAIDRLFDEQAHEGTVSVVYDLRGYVGALR